MVYNVQFYNIFCETTMLLFCISFCPFHMAIPMEKLTLESLLALIPIDNKKYTSNGNLIAIDPLPPPRIFHHKSQIHMPI